MIFRRAARPIAATVRLSSKVSGRRRSFTNRRSIFTVPLYRTPQTRAFEENPALLPGRSEANLTMIQIKQQERSYFRRLKKLRLGINENRLLLGVLTVQFGLLSKPVDPK